MGRGHGNSWALVRPLVTRISDRSDLQLVVHKDRSPVFCFWSILTLVNSAGHLFLPLCRKVFWGGWVGSLRLLWPSCSSIITWVFHFKKETFICIIELQKHGLPHSTSIFLDVAAKPITPAQLDIIVCAELPQIQFLLCKSNWSY